MSKNKDDLYSNLPETLEVEINGKHYSSGYKVYIPVEEDGVFKGYKFVCHKGQNRRVNNAEGKNFNA